MGEHTKIAVLESRWWDATNTSVRGLFELIADINTGNPNAYYYEMVGCECAAKEAIPRIAKYKSCKYLCIATHGDDNGLSFHNGDRLSRAEMRNLLTGIESQRGSTLDGIHMSSCSFSTNKLADFLFEREICLWWISGYSRDVDFIESFALDLLFFNELIKEDKETSIQAINRTARRINEIAPELVRSLGFGVFVRRQRTGGAKNLLEEF